MKYNLLMALIAIGTLCVTSGHGAKPTKHQRKSIKNAKQERHIEPIYRHPHGLPQGAVYFSFIVSKNSGKIVRHRFLGTRHDASYLHIPNFVQEPFLEEDCFFGESGHQESAWSDWVKLKFSRTFRNTFLPFLKAKLPSLKDLWGNKTVKSTAETSGYIALLLKTNSEAILPQILDSEKVLSLSSNTSRDSLSEPLTVNLENYAPNSGVPFDEIFSKT